MPRLINSSFERHSIRRRDDGREEDAQQGAHRRHFSGNRSINGGSVALRSTTEAGSTQNILFQVLWRHDSRVKSKKGGFVPNGPEVTRSFSFSFWLSKEIAIVNSRI